MADWDLTSKIGPYLDRHLVFPLLEFLSVKEYYDETDLLRLLLSALGSLPSTLCPLPSALCPLPSALLLHAHVPQG